MRINGIDVRHATMASVRDVVGVVTQDPYLFHDTLRANLLYARPEATEAEVLDALDQAQIGHIVAELPDGLDTVIGERGYRLSGGEKQRVALARLMLKAPDIVVLDEATAHLDSESEAAVQRALRETLSRPHLAGHRPPALDRPGGRRAAGDRRRAASWSGAPMPSLLAEQRPLRRALPDPVRRPGGGDDGGRRRLRARGGAARRPPGRPDLRPRPAKSRIRSSCPGVPGNRPSAAHGRRHTDQAHRAEPGGLPVHNELCERLGIEFPIFAFTHCRDVAAAVSNAGGMGVLGAVGFSADELEVELNWLDEHVGDRPYGVDIVIPGKYEGMGELDPVKLEEELRAMIPEEHRTFAKKILADHGVPELEGGPRRELLGWTAATAAPLVEVILRHDKVKLVANALGTPPDDVIAQVHDHGMLDRRAGGVGEARAQPQGGRRRHRHLPGLRGRRPHRRRRVHRAVARGHRRGRAPARAGRRRRRLGPADGGGHGDGRRRACGRARCG